MPQEKAFCYRGSEIFGLVFLCRSNRKQVLRPAHEEHIARQRRRCQYRLANRILGEHLVRRPGLQHLDVAIFGRHVNLPRRGNR
jgi:hypothetical protein